ncbi:MAG: hypothetical protein LBI34_00495 [Puniceicoccales bacterium]|jgi:hypothetical protein|nr:hypothetical protein [Puniceicoccales bacterium]
MNFTCGPVRAEDLAPFAPTVWARIQVYHPQQFLTQTIDHARNIHPHPSLHILPAILLGAWGYPDFHGLSQDDPVTVTFCRHDGEEHGLDWVARAKLTDASPINSTLELQGLKSKKMAEWTIVGRNEKFLSHAEANQNTLFPTTAKIPTFPSLQIELMDLPIKLFIGGLEGTILQNIAQAQTLGGSLPAISVLNLVLNLARQIENMECQLSAAEGKLEMQISVHARNGSDLAMLFDAPADDGGAAGLEAFLPPGGEMRWVCRSNPNVTKLLVHHIFDALFVYNKDHTIADDSDRDVYNFFNTVWNLCGGLTVARATFVDGENPVLYKLWAASLTPDQLGVWVDFVYNRIMPTVAREIIKMFWDGEVAVETKAIPKTFVYKKHPISRATINLDLTDGDTACHKYGQSYYYCAFGNFVAVTNSEKSIRSLIDEIASGVLPHAADDSQKLEHGTVFRFQSDRVPQSQKWIFPPLDLDLKFEAGTATLKMSIHSKLFGKWLQGRRDAATD